jgi:hypothetical protein
MKMRKHSVVGGVQVRPELMDHASFKELKEKFDEHEYEHYAYMLNVLIAIFEYAEFSACSAPLLLRVSNDFAWARAEVRCGRDLPMGAMNLYFLVKTIFECLEEDNSVRTCDLKPSQTTIILIGSAITSAASLAYKLAHVEVCTG